MPEITTGFLETIEISKGETTSIKTTALKMNGAECAEKLLNNLQKLEGVKEFLLLWKHSLVLVEDFAEFELVEHINIAVDGQTSDLTFG
jgi:methyl coenzyme M reductase subunit D